jgi:predicted O-methyltransferase YrrM
VTASPDYLASPEELERALGPTSAADLVLLAAHALRVGSLDYALALSELAPESEEPALALTRAAALFGLGQHAEARGVVAAVLARHPQHVAAMFYGAQMAAHGGDTAEAIELSLATLERFPDFPGAAGLLAGLRFPGPTYRDVLARLHDLLRPKAYLEIGIETGATLAFAKHAERVIGVDPDASKLRRDLVPPQAQVFHETSDAFFARASRSELLGARSVDLAFIDGMHLFEYALRDFVNAEAWCAPGGTIVLHDCVPLSALSASRERRTKFWVGDVWKVVSILGERRPELRVKIIATAPSGLCVVRGLDPSSTLLREQMDHIVSEYRDRPYPAKGLAVPDGFELVPSSAAGLAQALS